MKKIKSKRGSKRKGVAGLTLLEALIAILIISVLIILLFPLGKQMYLAGLKSACLGNVRNYGSMVMSLAAEGGIPRVENISQINFKSRLVPEYTENLPRCPLANGKEKKESLGFNYTANAGLFYSYPNAQSVPAPHARVVLAAETYGTGGFYSPSHFNMTMWGIRDGESPGPEQEGSVRRPQYHGPTTARGLNMIFLDGHAEFIRPTDNDWWNAPTLGTAFNGGYFYNRTQFGNMKAGRNW